MRWHPFRVASTPIISQGDPDNRDEMIRDQLDAVIVDLKAATAALVGVIHGFVDEAHVEAIQRNKP